MQQYRIEVGKLAMVGDSLPQAVAFRLVSIALIR